MTYAVYGLGNALVDIEVEIGDEFLRSERITKGHMTLVEADRIEELLERLEGLPLRRASGGSAANSIYAVQSFGQPSFYSCRVADDEAGNFFITDLTSTGVEINANAKSETGTSGRCLVMVSHDAERTMNTNLAISSELDAAVVTAPALRDSRYLYMEGYLSASEPSTDGAIYAREVAEEAGVKVSLSLSDPSMVEFCRDSLTTILGNGIDLIFCNEEEALAWARTDRIDIAISELKDIAPELYITLGAKGSLTVSREGTATAPGEPAKAVDTTGAGDIYAGACLAARCRGADPASAARFANSCAAVLVARYGARLESPDAYRELERRFT